MADLPRLLAVAKGDLPADLLITGGRILNVFSGQIERADIALTDGLIAGVGPGYDAAERIDVGGSFIAPGLIDAHVHIESSLCVPSEFASALLPRGVTSVIADPHEIANVAGLAGVRFMADASRDLLLNVIVMAPSCVPATHLATSGGAIDAADIAGLLADGTVHGLAEMMNVPGVLALQPDVMAKLAVMRARPIDGHCPGLTGKSLNSYIAAGIGSDHESTTPVEASEKLSRGLYLLIREATNARNLDALLPIITPANSRRICFCTDDRTPVELLEKGSIDEMVRRAIAFGIDPIDVFRMATLNTAECFGLRGIGAIGPGRRADFFVFDDLKVPTARMVFSRGLLLRQSGAMSAPVSIVNPSPISIPGNCRVDLRKVRFETRAPANPCSIKVVGCIPDQLLTDHLLIPAKIVDGHVVSDVLADVLKIVVIERHSGTGNHSAGFIKGFGLKRGAIAGTVAHDHHNLVVIGTDDASMRTAAGAVIATGGGLAVAVDGNVTAHLALPVAGLMSDRPITEVARGYAAVVAAARELGSTLTDPFMAMSFMTLEVIPSLKLTDRGLVDVERFEFVDLFS